MLEFAVGLAIGGAFIIAYVIGREDGYEEGYEVGKYEERRRNGKYDFRGFTRG